VTLENQWCYVTLAAVETVLIRLCAGISKHGFATGDSSVNLANKDCEVPFDILLTCLGKAAGYQTKLYFLYFLSYQFKYGNISCF